LNPDDLRLDKEASFTK